MKLVSHANTFNPPLSHVSPPCHLPHPFSIYHHPSPLHLHSLPTSSSSSSPKKINPYLYSAMADRPHPQQRYEGGFKAGQRAGEGGLSKAKILAVATLLPVGGSLLGLSGLTLAASLTVLAIATPIFLLCSPILVPAVLVAGLVLAALFASGLFGLTGLTALSWVLNYFRQVPQQLDEAKRKMQDVAVTVGQKTKEMGQAIQQKAQAQEAGK